MLGAIVRQNVSVQVVITEQRPLISRAIYLLSDGQRESQDLGRPAYFLGLHLSHPPLQQRSVLQLKSSHSR